MLDGLTDVISTEAAPADSASPAPSTTEGAPATEQSGEDWLDDITSAVSRTREPKKDSPAEPKEPAKAPPAAKDPAAPADPDAPKPEAAKPEETAAEKAEKRAREYSITDPAGQEVPNPLPEGAKIRYKADGKDVEHTFDELVAHASQGVHAQRSLSKLGQDLSVERRGRVQIEQHLEKREQYYREELDSSRELIKLALSDPEAAKQIQSALAKYDDPDFRELMDEREKKRAKEELEQTSQQGQQEAIWEEFWNDSVPATIDAEIAAFEFLTADDKPEVIAEFHGEYERAYNVALKGFTKEGIPEQQAHPLANKVAMGVLTEDTLKKVMGRIHQRYEKRLGPVKKASTAAVDAARAEDHNSRTDEKLARAESAIRPLGSQGGGDAAPTPAAGAKADDGGTMGDLLDSVSSALRRR